MRFSQPIDELISEVSKMPKENFFFGGIKENTLNFLVAQSKIGKTTLGENLGLCIAAGYPRYLDQDVWFGDNQRVMLLSLEEFYRSRTSRNSSQVQYMDNLVGGDAWHENVFTAPADVLRYIESKTHWDNLEAEIKDIQPAFTVIDSLSRLHGTESIEDSSTSIGLMKRLRNIVANTGTTLLVIHHTSKIGSEPLTLSNMAGSRIIAQEADAVLGMNKTPSGRRYIKPLAYRYADDQCEMVQIFKRNNSHWLVSDGYIQEQKLLREHDQRTDDSSSETVLNYIKEYTRDDISIIVETKDFMEGLVNPRIMSKPTLHKALGNLEEEGLIKKHSKGIYTLPQI
jgi:hypothetical protein